MDLMRTTCEECGNRLTLTTVDSDGVLIGDECKCGYYVTRYLPGQEPDFKEMGRQFLDNLYQNRQGS